MIHTLTVQELLFVTARRYFDTARREEQLEILDDAPVGVCIGRNWDALTPGVWVHRGTLTAAVHDHGVWQGCRWGIPDEIADLIDSGAVKLRDVSPSPDFP